METPEELGLTDVSFMLKPGVYVLMHGDEVVYIGRSNVLIQRVGRHTSLMTFDSVWIVICEGSDQAAVEHTLIDRYKPKYNVRFPYQSHDNQQAEAQGGKAKRFELLKARRLSKDSIIDQVAKWAHRVDGVKEMTDEDDVDEFMRGKL